jgi:hypothetical protein
MFLADAKMSRVAAAHRPDHRRHREINVTLGCKAVYPDQAIQAHLAFLARRRAVRATEEYRTPTDAEWEEFLATSNAATTSPPASRRPTAKAGSAKPNNSR